MFQSRVSFSLSRLFRLRKRRATKESRPSSPTDVPGPYSEPPPLPPPKSHRVSLHPESVNATPTSSTPTRRPRSVLPAPILTPIPQSVPASPEVSPVPGTPPPTILIRHDKPRRSALPLTPAPVPSRDLGPRLPVDGVTLLGVIPAPTARCVSFQTPIADRPTTPLSTCSTLVCEAQIVRAVPAELVIKPPAYEVPNSVVVGADEDADEDLVPGLPSPTYSVSDKARPKSLFTPRPVRADVTRLSLPPTKKNARRESRRTSVTSPSSPVRAARRESKRMSVSPPSSARREKRESRWNVEMKKPETQEVLRALSAL